MSVERGSLYLLMPHCRMLNNNKLTTLGREMLNGLSHLQTLMLVDNALSCDCHLAWLSRHLKTFPRLGQHNIRCASPIQLKNRNIVDLLVRELQNLFYFNIPERLAIPPSVLTHTIYFEGL